MDGSLRQSLAAIYREHRQGLFTLALARTGRADWAEDAVHDGFARVLAAGRQPAGDLTAYVYASVRHAAIDLGRKHATQLRYERTIFAVQAVGSHGPVSTEDPGAALLAAERRERLMQAVANLEEDDREIVVLHTLAGLTFAQTGQVLGEPLATVATRYRRALRKLQEQLTEMRSDV